MSGSSLLRKSAFSLAVISAFVFAPIAAEAKQPLEMSQTVPTTSNGLPDFDQLEANGPKLYYVGTQESKTLVIADKAQSDMLTAFIGYQGVLTTQKEPRKIVSDWSYTQGYELMDEGVKVDPSFARLRVVRDQVGSNYYALLHVLDGQVLVITKDFKTGAFYAHETDGDFAVKACICEKYNEQTKLLEGCGATPPLMTWADLNKTRETVLDFGKKRAKELEDRGEFNRKADETIEARRAYARQGREAKIDYKEKMRKLYTLVKNAG